MKRKDNDIGRPRKALRDVREFARFLASEMKPKGKIWTPFNIISGTIIVVGIALIAIRFYKGLGAVTNLSQDYPWGIWIGFDVITGVAFAGGAYVLTFVVHIMKFEKYEPIVRVTVLNGFLAYVFYAGALLLDLGRPWNVVNPIIGNSFGLSSVLFLVAWHFLLYMICEFLEFSPAVAEWLNWEKARRVVEKMTIGAVIFGITLSTLHQSGLGALFLLAPAKIHPLWYSHYIPVAFFVSSIFAGLSMVIIESTFTHKIFHDKIGNRLRASHDDILLGLAKGCIGALFAYLFLKVIELVHGGHADGLLVPRGDPGVRGAADLFVRSRAPETKRPARPVHVVLHGDRRGPQPAERIHHRVQVVCAGPVLSLLDRDLGDAGRHLHGTVGVPVGDQQDAGLQGAPGRKRSDG
jgi:formate-dependent nitrite reductase membrane component NrfD